MSWRALPVLLVLALGSGCFGGPTPAVPADPAYGVRLERSADIASFYERTSSFYGRLAQRRFNSRATYRDERLREFFRDETSFADYYAALATALSDAAFERNRPLRLEVLEFSFDESAEARVAVRLTGEDARPLRWGERSIEREDRWQQSQGRWWLTPGKL